MPALGLRHVALNVRDAQKSKSFYCEMFGMSVEWEPDAQSVYLTSDSQDNLALHETKDALAGKGALDHIGFFFTTETEVDALHAKAIARGCEIVAAPKKHRDGAYTFYFRDPDNNVVQVLCHPPLNKKYGVSK
jgi:catechol 2,3-dioxygenase-like lactoylglutathione lyase family enzyme